jgi:uncharacterized protein (TIGR00251 family)
LIAIAPHADGSVLPVLAQPGAKRNAILGERAGALRVAVTAPPAKGKANEAVRTVLAEALDCKPRQVDLISGATSRQKRFLIAGLSPAELHVRLAAILGVSQSKAASASLGDESEREARPH